MRKCFGFAVFFTFWAISSAWAQDALEEARRLFLSGQYVQSIEAAGRVIKAHPDNNRLVAEANYLSGAGYLHIFDFLTAKKNFKTVVSKYKGSAYYEDAYLGLGDVEFLQENFDQALKVYEEFLATNPSKKRLATLYFRLSETHLKLGCVGESRAYIARLQSEFPDSFEAKDAKRLKDKDVFYTVQVGAFTDYDNAEKFIAEVKAKGYEVYSVLCMLSGKKLCRIRVGKFKSLDQAEALQKKLAADGYYGKVFPKD